MLETVLAPLDLVHGLHKAVFNINWKVPCLVHGNACTPCMCSFFYFFTTVTNCTHGFITQLQDSAGCWYIQHLFTPTTQHTQHNNMHHPKVSVSHKKVWKSYNELPARRKLLKLYIMQSCNILSKDIMQETEFSIYKLPPQIIHSFSRIFQWHPPHLTECNA